MQRCIVFMLIIIFHALYDASRNVTPYAEYTQLATDIQCSSCAYAPTCGGFLNLRIVVSSPVLEWSSVVLRMRIILYMGTQQSSGYTHNTLLTKYTAMFGKH